MRVVYLFLAFLTVPTVAFAQANATASITAQVVSPISISTNTNMDFGILSVGATGGTVSLTPTPGGGCNISETGDVDQGSSSTTATCAIFDVSGAANAFYSVTLPASVTITDGGANSMTVDNFSACSAWAASCVSFQLDGTGTDQLIVGATLHVGGSQAQGTYTGTFTVTVEYAP